MPLLGKKKLGKLTSSDRTDAAKPDADQITTQITEKRELPQAPASNVSAAQADLSNTKKAPSAVAASAPSTPGRKGAVGSSPPPMPESTSSHARSHSFDLRRKLRMPSNKSLGNKSLGNKSSFGFRRVRTGTDTLPTGTANAEGAETTGTEQAATLSTPMAKAPGTPGTPGTIGFPTNSSSMSLRPFRSKESQPSTPKRGDKGKGKAREEDLAPPVPVIDPERFPNLASKTPQAERGETDPLTSEKPGNVVLLPRIPTSSVPATPPAGPLRAVTSPVYSDLSRSSPYVPSAGGLAPSISGAGLNLSSFSPPTSPQRPPQTELSPNSTRLPPYLMEKLSLEPRERILPLPSSSAELQERDASVILGKDKVGASPADSSPVATSGLAGFLPPKTNPLAYLIATKDNRGIGDESTATVIQRPEQGRPDLVGESDAALDYEDESFEGTLMSHAPTVMYDADEFLDAATAMETHDAEDTWYDSTENGPVPPQEKRSMPGSVSSVFSHTEQPTLMPSTPELNQKPVHAMPAIKETVPNVDEAITPVAKDPMLSVAARVRELPATPTSEPSDEVVVPTKSQPEEATSEPQPESKPTLLGSLSDAISSASSGIAMLVGHRDKTPEPKPELQVETETEPKLEPQVESKTEPKIEPQVEAKTEPKLEPQVETETEPKIEPQVETKPELITKDNVPPPTSSTATVRPPVPPRMRPLMTPSEVAHESEPAIPVAESQPVPNAGDETTAVPEIVPVAPLSLPPKTVPYASEPKGTEAVSAPVEPVERTMEQGRVTALLAEPMPEVSSVVPSLPTSVAADDAGVVGVPVGDIVPPSKEESGQAGQHDQVLETKPVPEPESQLYAAAVPMAEREPELVLEPAPVLSTQSVTEPVANEVPALPISDSVPKPATELTTEPETAPVVAAEPAPTISDPVPPSETAEPVMERAAPETVSAMEPMPTTVAAVQGADMDVSPTTDALADSVVPVPTKDGALPVEQHESAPLKSPMVQAVPTPVSKPLSFHAPSVSSPPWMSPVPCLSENRLPQLPPVLGQVPDAPVKDQSAAPTEAMLPAVAPKLPQTPEPAPAAIAAPVAVPEEVPAPASTTEPAAPESVDDASQSSVKRLSSMLGSALFSSAALPAFLRKKEAPSPRDTEKPSNNVAPTLPEKPRTSMLAPEPVPVASAPAVSNAGLPWSYVAATSQEPAPEHAGEPAQEAAADIVPLQAPELPAAAHEEAPLPDTPADTSASQGPLPWNLANAPFLPSAQTRFFESEHQLPHWHAPTEPAMGVGAAVDGAWPPEKLTSEPVVAPDAVDDEPDIDWDLEQPSRRYATEEPPAEPEPNFLQTVPEEQGEFPADISLPVEDRRAVAEPIGDADELRPAPALRGKGVYDPEMLNHFMHAMDENDYGRAVHRASTMGVPLEQIPSDTPLPATEGVNEPLRPSELFAGKGVRWDSPGWLRSQLHKVEGPSQEEFQAFLKKRRQIVPAFVLRDPESTPDAAKAPEPPKDDVPATSSSLLADWEQQASQPADARFSKLLLTSDSYLLSDSEPIDTSLLSLEQLEKSYHGKVRSLDPPQGAMTLAPPIEDVPPAVPPKSHLGHARLNAAQPAPMPTSPARKPDVELAQHLEQARRRQAAQYEQYDREQARRQHVSVLPPPDDGQEFYDEFGGTRPLYETEASRTEDVRPAAPAPEDEPRTAPAPRDEPRVAPGPAERGYDATYTAPGLSDQPSVDQGYSGYDPAYAQGYEQVAYSQGYEQPDYAQGYAPQGYAPQGYADQGYADHGYAPQGYADQGYVPQGYAPQGYAPQGYAPQGYAPQGYAPQGYTPQGYTPQGYTPQGYADPQHAQYGYVPQDVHASYAQGTYGWDGYGRAPHGYGGAPSPYPDPNQPMEPYGAAPASSMSSPVDAAQPRIAQSVSLTPLSKLGIPPAHQFSDSPFPQAATGSLSIGRDPMDMPYKPPTPKKGANRQDAYPASPASLPGDVPVAPRHHGYASSPRSGNYGMPTHRPRGSNSRTGWSALLSTDLSR